MFIIIRGCLHVCLVFLPSLEHLGIAGHSCFGSHIPISATWKMKNAEETAAGKLPRQCEQTQKTPPNCAAMRRHKCQKHVQQQRMGNTQKQRECFFEFLGLLSSHCIYLHIYMYIHICIPSKPYTTPACISSPPSFPLDPTTEPCLLFQSIFFSILLHRLDGFGLGFRVLCLCQGPALSLPSANSTLEDTWPFSGFNSLDS